MPAASSKAKARGPLLPRVAIAGRPNVGKSTLFNRLVGSRKAIVHPAPGVTRDYLSQTVEREGRRFELIDTGGLTEPVGDALTPLVWQAAEGVLEMVDVVVFMVDAKQGPTAADEMLAERLHRLDKPVLLVANKVDGRRDEAAVHDFQALGFGAAQLLSAEHGRFMDEFLEALLAALSAFEPAFSGSEEPEERIAVAIVGRPNVGKSSLLNALLGEGRALVSEIPGTTRDAVDAGCVRDGVRYVFIDTAGIRRRARVKAHLATLSVLRARAALERADVALLVLDSVRELARQDLAIGRLIKESGAATVLVLSKCDLIEGSADAEAMQRHLRRHMPFLDYALVATTSALRGRGIKALFQKIVRAERARRFRVPTARLNRDLKRIVLKNPPPSRGRAAFRLLYATQPLAPPPTMVLFANRAGGLTQAYLRYMERELRACYSLDGTPLRLLVRAKPARYGKGRAAAGKTRAKASKKGRSGRRPRR
ncbi:MAG: ribosome biogenesis GTPase Der [Acidobacteriota bacterium]|nr:MAG: ribosome biogenesis GTPase Der [Acidobacteriota bacterium]